MTGLISAKYSAAGMQEDDLVGKSFIVTTPITVSRNISALTDNEKLTPVAAGINLTLPIGTPRTFSAMFTPAGTGSITLTPDTGVTINGLTTVQTFTRAGGVVAITPTEVNDVWLASGANK